MLTDVKEFHGLKTEPTRKPNCWRIARTWLIILPVVLCFLLPTMEILWARWKITSAVDSATAIRLEEYSGKEILSSRILSPEEFSRVSEAVPFTCTVGIPGIIWFCFDPHHRVIITDKSGQESVLKVCFSCEQFEFSRSTLLTTPGGWRKSLRQLFVRHDISIRERYPLPE